MRKPDPQRCLEDLKALADALGCPLYISGEVEKGPVNEGAKDQTQDKGGLRP
jgi:hypothetical protein